VLRILGVSLSIGGGPLLEEVSLQVWGGQLVVIEGGRGAGKSTLLQVCAALRRPDVGQVWIAGRDVTVLRRSSLPYVRRNVGYLAGETLLLPEASVLENVTLALAARAEAPARARELALRALGRVGLLGAATRRVATLSASERRLCAVARALAGAPPLLVIDDPTAGLSPADAGLVQAALAGAREMGAAVLCASADAAYVAAAVAAGARRVRLEGGHALPGGGPIGVLASRRGDDEAGPPVRIEALR
jgi:cell division transport system ATP-binding protein